LGADVVAYDPEAIENTKKILTNLKVTYAKTMLDAATDCSALIIATEWDEFRYADVRQLASKLKEKVIFDGRNIFDADEMKKNGYYYNSIGRKTVDGRK